MLKIKTSALFQDILELKFYYIQGFWLTGGEGSTEKSLGL